MAEVKVKPKEIRAILGDLRMSPRKVRLVTDLIKNKAARSAVIQLQFSNKKAARPVMKLVNSALANARNNFQIDPNTLIIKRIFVDEGIALKRYKPRAQGRALPIKHRTSKVTLILTESAKLSTGVKFADQKALTEAEPIAKTDIDVDKEKKLEEAPKMERKTAGKQNKPKPQGGWKRRLFNRKTNA